MISFGSANPVRDTYYGSEHQHFVCRLGPAAADRRLLRVQLYRPRLEQGALGLLGQGHRLHHRALRPVQHRPRHHQRPQRRFRDPAGMAGRQLNRARSSQAAGGRPYRPDGPMHAVLPSRPLVSINIPCYHQLAAARRCVEAMLAQTLDDFEITLLDDGASDEYRRLWSSRSATAASATSATRRGSARCGNMFQAITAGRGKYTLAFHEDDLLGSPLSRRPPWRSSKRDPSCGFVGGELREFKDEPPPAECCGCGRRIPTVERFAHAAPISCGRSSAASSRCSDRWSIGAPRSTADGRARRLRDAGRSAVSDVDPGRAGRARSSDEPLVWYRHHGDGDMRHLAMNTEPHPATVHALPRGAAGARSAARIGRCSTPTAATGCSRCIGLTPADAASARCGGSCSAPGATVCTIRGGRRATGASG